MDFSTVFQLTSPSFFLEFSKIPAYFFKIFQQALFIVINFMENLCKLFSDNDKIRASIIGFPILCQGIFLKILRYCAVLSQTQALNLDLNLKKPSFNKDKLLSRHDIFQRANFFRFSQIF